VVVTPEKSLGHKVCLGQLTRGQWREKWTRIWFNKISAAVHREIF